MLAGDMIGAVVVSGVAMGGLVSLTLAPAELVAMLVLLWTGPGATSLRPSPPTTRQTPGVADLVR